ncbi:hypothetical protein QA596_05840 [Balneolales bacterium ANBcel1]|nr:hypothetical protein [Balneolales bacterium ANBcel1]
MDYRLGNNENGQVRYDWSDMVYRLRFEVPGFRSYVAYGNNLGSEGADTLNFVNAGANIRAATPLLGSARMGVSLPLKLSTDYIRVRSTDSSQPDVDHFRQSSVGIGLGIGLFYQISGSMRVSAEAIPQIGFSFSALGSDSGQFSAVNGSVRFHLDQLISRFGLVAGFDYSFRRYSGGSDINHHDIQSNNVTLGISF